MMVLHTVKDLCDEYVPLLNLNGEDSSRDLV